MRRCRRGGVVFGRGCRRGGVVFGRGCRRVRGGRLWCGGWNEYRPRRRRTDYWLGLVGVFVDNRDPKLRRLVYVVVVPARVKANGNRPVTGGLDTVVDNTMACRICLLAGPESQGDQMGELRPDTLIVRFRLAGIENHNTAMDIARRGRGKRAVDASGDRQTRAFSHGT